MNRYIDAPLCLWDHNRYNYIIGYTTFLLLTISTWFIIFKFDISGTSLNCMTVLFSDNGAISEDYSKHILSHTVGLGLRFIINKGLIVRTDYGSSISHKDSSFALIVDHIF